MSLALWAAGAWAGRLLGEVLERHETVVGFFGQTQHGISLDGGWPVANPTVLVLVSVRRKGVGCKRPGFDLVRC